MLPLAQAQADAGGKLAEQYLREQEALSMDKVTDMEQYLAYRQRFVEVAKTQYGLTESQAEMYLKESDALSGLNTEYALAEAMLKNFNGATDETIKNLRTDPKAFAEYTNAIK
jgi:hypothetical protein